MNWTAYWTSQPADQRPKRAVKALKIASKLGTYPAITPFAAHYRKIYYH